MNNLIFLLQSLDAALYLIQGVSENVDSDEETYIPGILSLLPRLPSHPSVAQTALLMVGKSSPRLQLSMSVSLSFVFPAIMNMGSV